jgi:hypothetical protein
MSGSWNGAFQPGFTRRKRAKAEAGSKDAPIDQAQGPRTDKDWSGIKLAAREARHAMLAAARAARAATMRQEEALEALRERLHRAEELLQARNTEIANLKAKVRYFEQQSPRPRMTRSLHRQVLSLLHPDRAHQDEALRKKLEKCFQEFSAVTFTFPPSQDTTSVHPPSARDSTVG